MDGPWRPWSLVLTWKAWEFRIISSLEIRCTKAKKKAHDDYKKWTAHTKQKQMAGFTASLRSAAGDDSLNQSQND